MLLTPVIIHRMVDERFVTQEEVSKHLMDVHDDDALPEVPADS